MLLQDSPLVSNVYVATLIDSIKGYGLDITEFLEKSGLTPSQLSSAGEMIPASKMNTITHLAETAIPNPDFWFAYGESLTIATHGTFGHALMACQNLGGVIDFFHRYYHIQMPMLLISRTDYHDCICLELDRSTEEIDELSFGAEVIFSAFSTNLKILLNEDTLPIEFYFDSAKRHDPNIYYQHLGPNVYFDNNSTLLKIPLDYLSHPIVFSNPLMKQYYADQCEQQLQRLTLPSGIVARVTSLITITPGYFASIDQIASQLNMSERTLRRKLREAGTSFRDILDNIKEQKSCELLANHSLSVEHIAHLLGYSDAANFRRAFQKWTGVSPAAYRKN